LKWNSRTDPAIRQDAEGRLSLKDLHKTAGNGDRHKPGNWLSFDQTSTLAAELNLIAEFPAIKKSPLHYGGTIVAWHLVYAYAEWIRPNSHCQVSNARDGMRRL
jgi:hypothetical protein